MVVSHATRDLLSLSLKLVCYIISVQFDSSTFINNLSPSYLKVQQKQSVSGEEEGKDSETPVRETDSQYGTWETGLRTDDR